MNGYKAIVETVYGRGANYTLWRAELRGILIEGGQVHGTDVPQREHAAALADMAIQDHINKQEEKRAATQH